MASRYSSNGKLIAVAPDTSSSVTKVQKGRSSRLRTQSQHSTVVTKFVVPPTYLWGPGRFSPETVKITVSSGADESSSMSTRNSFARIPLLLSGIQRSICGRTNTIYDPRRSRQQGLQLLSRFAQLRTCGLVSTLSFISQTKHPCNSSIDRISGSFFDTSL
jgi:hypothetical protein